MAELEDLSFSVNGAGITSTASALDKLASSLDRLSNSVKSGMLDNVAKSIQNISNAVSGIDDGKLSSLADALERLSRVKDINIRVKAGGVSDSINKGMSNLPATVSNASNNMTAGPKFERVNPEVIDPANINDVGDGIKMITHEADTFDAVWREVKSETDNIDEGIKRLSLTDILSQVSGIAGKLKDASSVTGITSSINDLWSSLGNVPVVGMFTGAMDDMGSSITKVLSSGFNPLEKALLSVTAGGLSAYRSLIKMASAPFSGMAAKIEGLKASWDHFTSSIGRIAIYRIIRSAIKDIGAGIQTGINNLYQWALTANNSFAPSMDRIATSVQYLKNSFGAMVSPLIDMLAPAIDWIIDKLVSLLNVINQVLAALSGATVWRKAVKATKAYGAAAGKAAKQNDTLTLSIDELHILNQQTGSGGGGASTPDYSNMFKTMPLSDYFKDMFKTDDWTKYGQDLADKLNAAMASIDWSAIEKTCQMWAKRIYTFINGFIGELDWSLVGYTLAMGLNVALHFLDTLAQNINFLGLGTGIGTALNTAVSTLDWNALGNVLTDGMKIAFEVLHGFITTFNWDNFRAGLQTAIKAAFANIDWEQAFGDLSTLAIQILATIDSVIQAIPWDELGKALQAVDWGGIIQGVLDIIWDLAVGLAQSGLGTVVFPALGGFIGLQIGMLFGPMGALIGLGIGALVGLVIDFLAANWGTIQNWFTTTVNFVYIVFNGIVIFIEGEFLVLAGIVCTSLNIITGIIDTAWAVISSATQIVWDTIKAIIQTVWNVIWGVIQTVGAIIVALITGDWDTALNKTTEIWNNIWTTLQTIWNNLFAKVKEVWDNMIAKIRSIWDDVSAKTQKIWNDIYTTLLNKWNDFITGAKDKFDQVESTITGIFTGIIDKVKGWGSDMINGFIDGIKSVWDNFTSTISDIASTVSSYLHFSAPDKGPLKEYEQWMPDFMRGLANGINSNSYLVTDAMNKLTGDLANQQLDPNQVSISANDIVSGEVDQSVLVKSDDMKLYMEDIVKEQISPLLSSIDTNTRKQADKDEKTVVNIGNREVYTSVMEQADANGYAFRG